MVSVAIVYHSGYGHTAVLAQSVASGIAGVAGVEAHLVAVEDYEAKSDLINAADAVVFGSPTYMGSVSGPFKMFMDASSKVWYGRGWQDKLAAGFTVSASQSGDKLNTLIQLAIFAAQHGMVWIGNSMMPGNNSSAGSVEDLNRLGSFLGAMAQANADQGPDQAPPQSDRKTAEQLGKRVAEATLRWVRGKA
ncbi:MAG: flavodoxin family protein [Magnetospirillum sp.]|nr:flavodoxin family protein [Magnetospirillum sp.]